jgi:transcriptional regulator
MALTLDERVEIVLLIGRQGWTQRQVADEFNARHPERNPITHKAVGKLVKKFKETSMVKRLRKCVECRCEHNVNQDQVFVCLPTGQ